MADRVDVGTLIALLEEGIPPDDQVLIDALRSLRDERDAHAAIVRKSREVIVYMGRDASHLSIWREFFELVAALDDAPAPSPEGRQGDAT